MKEKVKFSFTAGDSCVRLISCYTDEGEFHHHKAVKITPEVTCIAEGGHTEYVLDAFCKWSQELRL